MNSLNRLIWYKDMVRLFTYSFFICCLFIPFTLKAAPELQPHRAYYTIAIEGPIDPNSSISDVRGTMMLECNKVLGGWTVQQLSEIWRYQNDGSVEHIRSGYVTWESKDGSAFTFNSFRKEDDELVEDIRGTAKRVGRIVQVAFQKPKKKNLHLPEGVLFPIQHTKELLNAARLGEHILPRIVFDGSNLEGASEINAFIGAKKVLAGNPKAEDAHQFANQPFWPIRFAIDKLGETAYEPLYTTTQDLLENGIIKQYVIDNDGVKVRGTLERVELLSGGSPT